MWTMCPRLLAGAVLSLALCGCATVVKGTRQRVSIATEPSGATVTVGIETFTTPASVKFSRNREHTIEIAKAGYETEVVRLQREFNHWMMGNVLFVFIPGIIVDCYSGGMWDLAPAKVELHLTPAAAP